MISEQVIALRDLGPFPAISNTDPKTLSQQEVLLASIEKPISDDEVEVLVTLFGSDDYFGLAWTLVHLIESAPGWPIVDCLVNPNNEWLVLLRDRAIRAGRL